MVNYLQLMIDVFINDYLVGNLYNSLYSLRKINLIILFILYSACFTRFLYLRYAIVERNHGSMKCFCTGIAGY